MFQMEMIVTEQLRLLESSMESTYLTSPFLLSLKRYSVCLPIFPMYSNRNQ
uniref:Uncharacterized protein n=1 Tax=Amphimedon queenslandica TaxID=400682 RepID=A0A1X7UQQ9_AMPQE